MNNKLLHALAKDFLVSWLTDRAFKERVSFRELRNDFESLRSWFEGWPFDQERLGRLKAVLSVLEEDGWVQTERRGKRGRPRATVEPTPHTTALWAQRVLNSRQRYAESTVRKAKAALGESRREDDQPSYYLRLTDKVFALFEEVPPPLGQTATEWALEQGLPVQLAKRWVRREVEAGNLRKKTVRGKRVYEPGGEQ